MTISHRKRLFKFMVTACITALLLWRPTVIVKYAAEEDLAQHTIAGVVGRVQQVFSYVNPLFGGDGEYDKSASRPPIRVTLWDQRYDSHDEVMAPLIYTLNSLPSVTLRVHRDTYRAGFYDLVRPYYGGGFFPARTVLKRRKILDDTDVLVIATTQRNLADLLDHFDLLNDMTHLRIVTVVHNTRHLAYEPPKKSKKHHRLNLRRHPGQNNLSKRAVVQIMAKLHAMKRLSFLTLAPHVTHSLEYTLRDWEDFSNVTDISIKHFLPILPYWGKAREPRERLTRAVIQGELANRARDYDRIFDSLRRELRDDPGLYGYNNDPSGATGWTSLNDGDVFKLDLVGSNAPKAGYEAIPQDLQDVVTMSKRLTYPEFYGRIAEALYTSTKASSSIPAAIMSRVPLLLSTEEASAFTFLRGPAFLLRDEGQDELQAISRLRKTKESVIWSSDAEWLAFEQEVLGNNEKTMVDLLYQ